MVMCGTIMGHYTGGPLCVQPADGSLINAGVWAKEQEHDTHHLQGLMSVAE